MVKTDTRLRILEWIRVHSGSSVTPLAEALGISPQALHRHLKSLVDDGLLKKIGNAPRVQYLIRDANTLSQHPVFSQEQSQVISKHFMQVKPSGQLLEGEPAFVYWCEKFKLDPAKTAREYLNTVQKYERFRKESLIDGTEKLRHTFKQVYVDQLYYMDFYAIERFGKTRLGLMLLLAKQSQSKIFIQKLKAEIKNPINALIKRHHIDGIAFVPPSVKRQTQIMKELNKAYGNLVKPISIKRLSGDIVVPQKSLSKLEDRIANVHEGFIISASGPVKNLLLVDDALGSGATLNEIGHMIRSKKLCTGKIIALSITGSPKGFEVIQEV